MPRNKLSIEEILKQEQAKKADIDAKKAARLVGNFFRAEGVRANSDKISRASKEMWQKPEHKAKRQKTLTETNRLPEVQKRRSQAAKELHRDPEKRQAWERGMLELRNDPQRWAEYQKNYRKGNLSKYDNPDYWVNYYAGIERREQDKSYHQRRIQAANAKICRRVQTPLGVFDSITLAAQAHGMSNTETMRHRLKSPNFPEYFLLDDNYKPKKRK